ncbi:MAG: hypothetical protein R3E68_07545 [Burkholderiaceae bacterium]
MPGRRLTALDLTGISTSPACRRAGSSISSNGSIAAGSWMVRRTRPSIGRVAFQ